MKSRRFDTAKVNQFYKSPGHQTATGHNDTKSKAVNLITAQSNNSQAFTQFFQSLATRPSESQPSTDRKRINTGHKLRTRNIHREPPGGSPCKIPWEVDLAGMVPLGVIPHTVRESFKINLPDGSSTGYFSPPFQATEPSAETENHRNTINVGSQALSKPLDPVRRDTLELTNLQQPFPSPERGFRTKLISKRKSEQSPTSTQKGIKLSNKIKHRRKISMVDQGQTRSIPVSQLSELQ